jgi:hypothetical protein
MFGYIYIYILKNIQVWWGRGSNEVGNEDIKFWACI